MLASARQSHPTNSMEQYNAKLVSLDFHPAHAVLRSFGLALALLCVARAAWSWAVAQGGGLDWTHGLYTGSAVALASLAWWRSGWLRMPYLFVSTLTFPVRWLIAFATLATLYFLVLTPVACILRVTRRGPHSRGVAAPTSWRISPARGDKPSYFRQF